MKICQPIEKRATRDAGQACSILSVNCWTHKNGLSIDLASLTNTVKMRKQKARVLTDISPSLVFCTSMVDLQPNYLVATSSITLFALLNDK
jgi:hypothetical protein